MTGPVPVGVPFADAVAERVARARAQVAAQRSQTNDGEAASRPDAVIFDMDGTFVDVNGIRHHVVPPDPRPKGWKPNFHAFHMESVDCPPNEEVVEAAHKVDDMDDVEVVVVTARRAMYRHVTAWWLALRGVPSSALYMRPDGDSRPDYEVKRDILASIRRRYNVVHAVDDNPNVIRLWEEEGISTSVVPGWNGQESVG